MPFYRYTHTTHIHTHTKQNYTNNIDRKIHPVILSKMPSHTVSPIAIQKICCAPISSTLCPILTFSILLITLPPLLLLPLSLLVVGLLLLFNAKYRNMCFHIQNISVSIPWGFSFKKKQQTPPRCDRVERKKCNDKTVC